MRASRSSGSRCRSLSESRRSGRGRRRSESGPKKRLNDAPPIRQAVIRRDPPRGRRPEAEAHRHRLARSREEVAEAQPARVAVVRGGEAEAARDVARERANPVARRAHTAEYRMAKTAEA